MREIPGTWETDEQEHARLMGEDYAASLGEPADTLTELDFTAEDMSAVDAEVAAYEELTRDQMWQTISHMRATQKEN